MAFFNVLFALGALFLLLIMIPYHFRVVFEKQADEDLFLISLRWTQIIFEISFLGGLPTFTLILFGKSVTLPRRWFEKAKKKGKPAEPFSPRGERRSDVPVAAGTEEVPVEPRSVYPQIKKYWIFVKPGKRLLRNLLRAFEFETIDIDLQYGHSDPSLTGRLYGWYWASFPFRTISEKVKTRFRPDFQKMTMGLRAQVEIQFWIYRLLTAMIRFLIQASMEWLHRRWTWVPKPSY